MIALLLAMLLQIPSANQNTISKNGMTVQWEFIDTNKIQFKVNTPSSGWAAIGINTENKLVGSNLIMASVSDFGNVISDRFVVGFGNHQSMRQLGVDSKIKLLSAKENKSGTEVIFEMASKATDNYHFNLQKGTTIFLTIAYSHDDDFMHHSAMRTIVQIIL